MKKIYKDLIVIFGGLFVIYFLFFLIIGFPFSLFGFLILNLTLIETPKNFIATVLFIIFFALIFAKATYNWRNKND